MLLGSLIKAATRSRLFPAPNAPYQGRSVDALIDSMAQLRVRSLCDYTEGRQYSYHPVPDIGHSVITTISTTAAELSEKLHGFDLEEFLD